MGFYSYLRAPSYQTWSPGKANWTPNLSALFGTPWAAIAVPIL